MTSLEPEKNSENTYTFRVQSSKNDSFLDIPIRFIKNGWFVELEIYPGECVKDGFPYIYRIFDKIGIEVPYKIRDYFERLWHMADQGTYTHDQIQNGFDELTKWIRKLSMSKPEGSMWEEEVSTSD